MNEYPEEATKEEIEIAESIIYRVLDLFDLGGQIEIRRRREGTILDIQGCSNAGRLIGTDGMTLHAIQLLTTMIVCRKIQRPTNISIDVNGYRHRRRMQLEDMAWRAADRVRDSGRSIALKPMIAADRRIIHMVLSEEGDIETLSIDEDPETGTKSVLISLAGPEGGGYEEGDYQDR